MVYIANGNVKEVKVVILCCRCLNLYDEVGIVKGVDSVS